MRRRRVLLLLTIATALVATAAISIVLLLTSSASSERRTLGGPAVPGCGTGEERVSTSDITLEEAQKLVDACLAAYSPGSQTSPTPGPSGDVVTYPLKEAATIVLSDGSKLDLPAGTDFARQMGMAGDFTVIILNDSRLYFETGTWKPAPDPGYVATRDRPAMLEIVEQLAANHPDFRADYQAVIDSYLRDGLPDQAPMETPRRY